MIKVEHVKNIGAEEGVYLYVGRANKDWKESLLANPYHIGKDGDRKGVIAKYRRWLWDKISNNDYNIMRELFGIIGMAERQDVYLCCYCYPQACHADIIKRACEWIKSEGLTL